MKLSKILFLTILLFSFSVVKADATMPLVDTNYNTVYRGDVLDFKMGFDYKWFTGIVMSDSDNKNVTGDRFEYKMERFYFAYDNTIFDVDFLNMQVMDEDYVLINYEREEYDDKTFIIFEFDIRKDFGDPSVISERYNGKIDNLVLSNIKIKVKDDVEFGTYFIESNYLYYDEKSYTFDEYYNQEYSSDDSILYPITVISREKVDDSINDVIFKTYTNFDNFNTTNLKIVPNKYDYSVSYFALNDEIGIYTMCNSKCKINGIGSSDYNVIISDTNARYHKLVVEYESGKKEEYSILDEYSKSSIDHYYWTTFYSNTILVLGSSDDTIVRNYKNTLAQYYSNYNIYYYDYDKLNDTDKSILDLLKKDINVTNGPYICEIIDGKIVFEHIGYVENDEWENLFKNQDEIDNVVDNSSNNKLDNNNNNNNKSGNNDVKDIMDSLLKDRMDELEIKYDYSSLDKFIVENYNIVLICLTAIISLLFVFSVILFIKNIKLKKSLKNKTTN